jgi:alkylation response protein AidB-like acyl-CoA dehydrogenase
LLCFNAAYQKDQGMDISQSGAMAKLFASQTAMDTTIEAVQIHGGNGYVAEYHVERMMRDAKITQIYEGTSEIQRIVISRTLIA